MQRVFPEYQENQEYYFYHLSLTKNANQKLRNARSWGICWEVLSAPFRRAKYFKKKYLLELR